MDEEEEVQFGHFTWEELVLELDNTGSNLCPL